MIAYAHTIGDYGMNARNFGIIRRFIRTLMSMLTLRSMVHTHINDLRALFPEEQISMP